MTKVLWLDEEHIAADVSSNLGAGLSKQLPQQTSPHPSFATEVMKHDEMRTVTLNRVFLRRGYLHLLIPRLLVFPGTA